MAKFEIRDNRTSDKFVVDDEYLNGMAQFLDPHTTAVYFSLCRFTNYKTQKSFPSQERIAKQHNISVRTVKRKIKNLHEHNLIQIKKKRTKKGTFKHNVYILMDKSVWIYPENDHPSAPDAHGSSQVYQVTQSHLDKNQVTQSHPNNINNISMYKKNSEKKLSVKKKKYSSLKDITKQDIEDIAEHYNVDPSFVALKFESLKNYCESKGKRYKNYKSALRNFVLGDISKKAERRANDKKKGIDASQA